MMKRPPMTGLREIRIRRGLTQGQLGNLVDRSNAFIAELELGRKGASIETLQRLALALVSIHSRDPSPGRTPVPYNPHRVQFIMPFFANLRFSKCRLPNFLSLIGAIPFYA